MKKMIKLSLVAAMAVAGLSTAAAAEDTKFSGKLYVEQHLDTVDTASTSGETKSNFEIDFDVTGKKKISDTLTAVVGIEADSANGEDSNITKQSVTVDDAYFAYANNGIAAKFGRQGINTPSTDGELGQGLMATYTKDTITVAAAHFSSSEEVFGTNDVHAVALLGTAGPVNFELWNVGVASTVVNNTAVVSAKVSGWTVAGRLATSSYDGATKDGATTILSAAGKVNKIGLTALLINTDKDGAAFVTDASSKNTAELTYFSAKGLMDATAVVAIASYPLTEKVTVIGKYGTASFDQSGSDSDKASEFVAQVNYKLAKTTTLTGRYSFYDQEIANADTEKTQARLDITYKF